MYAYLQNVYPAKDYELIQTQHSCNDGGTFPHPNSSYITIDLHGTSACGCNNNATRPRQGIGYACQRGKLVEVVILRV